MIYRTNSAPKSYKIRIISIILTIKDRNIFLSKRKPFSEETHSPKYLKRDQSSKTMLSEQFSHRIPEKINVDGQKIDTPGTKAIIWDV